MDRPRLPARLVAMVALLANLTGGCAQFRVPKIDPTGQQLFVPGESTTLVSPFAGTAPVAPSQGTSVFPQPAWTTPPVLPPCGPTVLPQAAPAVVAPACPPTPVCPPVAVTPPIPICPPAAVLPQVQVPAAPALPAPAPVAVTPVVAVGQDTLVVSPVRIIAPAGGQVVLLAGLRNPAGQFKPGQSIEWILSQESVGHFVEVGQEHDFLLCHWRHHAARKLSPSYALGRTARADQVITRGNADPADDVWVMRGQAWVSVSSPAEGVSLVTAVAPEAESWDRRQQTAEIYWVNAQWSLPAPAQVRARQPHALTTVVTRPGSLEPVAGWIVRYDIVAGASGAFTQQGDQGIDVVTDATGAATAAIYPQANAAGATQVRIQIIRPGTSSQEPSRLVIGEGATTVSWIAPALAANIAGPASAGVNTTLSYRIDVTNPGDMPVAGVAVTYHAPPGLTILDSSPAGSVFGQRIEWQVGDLAPGGVQSLVVNCRADQAGEFNNCVVAQAAADGLTAENCVLTRVVQPSISLNMTGPQEAEVGQQVQFVVTVTNASGVELPGVIVTDHFDEGLEHAASASPIERDLGNLAAGEQKQFAITFRVTRPGRLCHTMTATTATGQTATTQACVVAREPPPQQLHPGVTVRTWGPREVQVGQTGEYFVEVTNSGQTPLTAVRLAVATSPSLQVVGASAGDNRQVIGGQVVWTINRIEVGDARRFGINCQAVQADPQAVLRSEATAREQVQHAAQATTQVVAAPAQPAPAQPAPKQPAPAQKPDASAPPAPPAGQGELQVVVDDLDDPVRAGQNLRYQVILKNTRNAPDENVQVTITLPENSTLVRLAGPTQYRQPAGRLLTLPPILTIRAGEELRFVIEVSRQQPGTAVFRATVTSNLHRQPIVVEEQTTVL